MSETERTGVLFVCLGNICRSPLAEGIFLHRINQRQVGSRFRVDSAGTGDWHVGAKADLRMRRVAAAHGVELISRARQVSKADLHEFDLLVCMDEDNRRTLLQRGAPDARVRLLLEFDPRATFREVPDPYFGGEDGFEIVYRLVDDACEAMIEALLADVT